MNVLELRVRNSYVYSNYAVGIVDAQFVYIPNESAKESYHLVTACRIMSPSFAEFHTS